ncbi:MAG TPA: pitrilysin family protein [Bryobacteraceae bacterium]|jgi:predicted Zn-dependent peptidase
MSKTFCAALLSFAATLSAAGPLNIPFKEYKLDNGLRVILSEDHTAPSYSIAVTYDVGSRDEKEGRTGFAHLFEHMMFQGSENIGKGEHFMLVYTNGGEMNGTTSQDRTNYFETLPSNQLDLGLFLESDRMRSLVVSQGNLDNQRNAVQEEKRMGQDNQPYGKTFDTDIAKAYDSFAYRHSIIGSMEDLNAATVQDVQGFFKRYYAPNNAVLTLVGDFKSDEVLAKIKKYFGNIPEQPAPPKPDVAEPEQKAERRETIHDPFAQVPRVDVVYKIAPGNTKDFYAMDVLADVLSAGTSSRLYQSLVKEKQIAVQAAGFAYEHRGPSLAMFIAFIRPGTDPAEVEKAIQAEIERVKKDGITDEELEKIRMQNKVGSIRQLESTRSRAVSLGQFAVYYNDPNLINTELEKSQSVTKEDVLRVARQYLVDTNKTIVLTMPKSQEASK